MDISVFVRVVAGAIGALLFIPLLVLLLEAAFHVVFPSCRKQTLGQLVDLSIERAEQEGYERGRDEGYRDGRSAGYGAGM